MSLSYLIGLVFFAGICHSVEIQQNDIEVEVCVWEAFKASCSEDEEINIRSAFYGRMGSERCLNNSLNEYNCSGDVQSYVKHRCKERTDCVIDLPDNQLDALSSNNCPKSAIQYLEVVYKCHNRKSSCPEFKPPEFARAEKISTGFRVLCIESDFNTWEVTCVQGNWTPQLLNRCKPREKQQSGIKAKVCLWENFKANCSDDEEINIRSAFYGVMGSERCMNAGNKSFNEYNCSTDVQSYVERRCNERTDCLIELPDVELDALSANYCSRSTIQYLEIVYECHNRKSSCPEFKPPEFARAEKISTGFRVLCIENDIDTWDVTCVQGNWTPQHLNHCKTRESSCPEFKSPEFARAEKISTGFRVLCIENDIDRWDVTCVQGNWTPQLLNRCKPRESSCPEFKSPEFARAEKISTGFRVLCIENDIDRWDVTCVQGNWTPQLLNRCKPRGENHVLAFAILSLGAIISVVFIVTVFILLRCRVKYQTQHMIQPHDAEVLPSGMSLPQTIIYSEPEELRSVSITTLKRHAEKEALGRKVGTFNEEDHIYSFIDDTKDANMIALQNDESLLYATIDSL